MAGYPLREGRNPVVAWLATLLSLGESGNPEIQQQLQKILSWIPAFAHYCPE